MSALKNRQLPDLMSKLYQRQTLQYQTHQEQQSLGSCSDSRSSFPQPEHQTENSKTNSINWSVCHTEATRGVFTFNDNEQSHLEWSTNYPLLYCLGFLFFFPDSVVNYFYVGYMRFRVFEAIIILRFTAQWESWTAGRFVEISILILEVKFVSWPVLHTQDKTSPVTTGMKPKFLARPQKKNLTDDAKRTKQPRAIKQ